MYPSEKPEVKQFGKLFNEVELYFYYSSLISVKRSKEAQRRINDLIKRTNSLPLRVREIEEIDRNDRELHPDIYGKVSAKKEKPIILIDEIQREKAIKNKRKKVKAPSFLSYLLTLRYHLKIFSKNTLTIIPRFLGLIYKFSPVYYLEINNIYKYKISYADKPFQYAVDAGWQYLDKHEYNVIFTFNNFLNEFEYLVQRAKTKNVKPGDMMICIDKCAPHFLELIFEAKNKDILVSAIKKILITKISFKKLIPKILELVYHIFDINIEHRNFTQTLIATFTLYYKKEITLKEIFAHYGTTEIKTDAFICNEIIAAKIAQKISEISHRIDEIEKRLFLVKFIDETQKLSEIKNSNFRKIAEQLITSSGFFKEKTDKPEFLVDYFFSDLIRTLKYIVSGFLVSYNKILMGEFEIENTNESEPVRIFDPSIFAKDISELKSILSAITVYMGHEPYIHITGNSYLDYINFSNIEVAREEEGFKIVKRVSENLYSISEKILYYLYHHQSVTDKIQNNIETSGYSKLAIDISEDEPRLIPYHFEIISEKKNQKKTILECLSDIAFITSNLSFLLSSQSINEIFKNVQKLIMESEELLQEKKRYLE